jgi:hypothetical protein
MRTFVAAAVTIALLTMPAYSQPLTNPKKHHPPGQKTEESKNKVDEKAYKSALDRIPDPKQQYDPWQNVRETPRPK